MKTTEFIELLHEIGAGKVFAFFIGIGALAALIALTIIYFHVHS
jgi:hypothetical protein